VNPLMKSENAHVKTYLVTLNQPFDTDFLRHMASGVDIVSGTHLAEAGLCLSALLNLGQVGRCLHVLDPWALSNSRLSS
jgi:hypothetical protein